MFTFKSSPVDLGCLSLFVFLGLKDCWIKLESLALYVEALDSKTQVTLCPESPYTNPLDLTEEKPSNLNSSFSPWFGQHYNIMLLQVA